MICKDVEFSLRQVEPDLWKWQFQIGDTVTRGQNALAAYGYGSPPSSRPD
jgi:hypothetical protein